MIPTPEEAWALLCEYNQGEFHQKHGRIVWKLVLKKATVYRTPDGELRVHIYPKLPK